MFLLALPMCTDSGVYILEILDHHVSGVPMLVIALLEILLVSYVYGKLKIQSLYQKIKKTPYLNRHWSLF